MSEENGSKNVVSIWILVVLIGGMSVPFWRWNTQPELATEPVQWVEPSENGAKHNLAGSSSRVTPTADVNNPYPSPVDGNQLLQEFSASDPTMKLQDAVRASKERPGITKQFQGEGIPLTDIQPWLPKADRFDASPTQQNRFVGTEGTPVAVEGLASDLYNPKPFQWPDSGYRGANEPAAAPTPQNSIVNPSNIASQEPTPSSPGRTVSAIHSPSTDPPALMSSPLSVPDNESASGNQTTNSKPVVTVKPSAQSGTSPLVPSKPLNNSPASRKPGTMIRQPSRNK
jgi:hypothetical protein